MLSRSLNSILRISSQRATIKLVAKNSTATTTAPVVIYEKDPAPYFFNEDVQKLLKTITRPIPDKIFRTRLDGRSLEAPEYKFMTKEQLDKAKLKAEKKMWELLQMPPVVKVREEDTRIFSRDPALQGYSPHKHVFTDITYGLSNKTRIIAVREPDGVLRAATNAERDRILQIYFPLPGREVTPPRMFQEEHLQPILDREDYEFILNRACIQYEPDNPDFHRIQKITFDHVNEMMHHDKLRSTRHFGPMVFYLAWTKQLDNLLIENITTEKIEDAAIAIKLYYILHPSNDVKTENHIELIQHYIKTDAINKRKLDQVIRTHLELVEERKKVEENIKQAHGITKSENNNVNNL